MMKGIPIQDALRTVEEHQRAGRFVEAENVCKQILRQQPREPNALALFSILARQQGQFAVAADRAAEAARVHPEIAEFHANLGEFSRLAGKFDRSAESFRRAVELNPSEPTFRNGLGTALDELRQYELAVREYQRAVELKPDYAIAYSNLAANLRQLNRLAEAAEAAGNAIRVDPQLAAAHYNLGGILALQGRYQDAMAAYSRAIAINPGFREAHTYLGTIYLVLGDLENGWKEHEWRSIIAHQPHPKRWRGGNLNGKTILLMADQGFGDQIQFSRYAPMVAEMGGRVILACHETLTRLMSSLPNIAQIIPLGQPPPPFDLFCPLMSVPIALGTTLQNIPAKVPYLKSERPRPIARRAGLRVGLVWAGNPGHYENQWRTIQLERLAPLWAVERVEFHSLQKGEASKQAKEAAGTLPLIDQTDELQDFSDTADLIASLDLVIAVDTAVAHLAGAMGKPVWVLLPFAPDWRWLLEREDSPWYPTMRLFRQSRPDDWAPVIGEVVRHLRRVAQNG